MKKINWIAPVVRTSTVLMLSGILSTPVFAVAIGDSYDKVVKELGKPSGVMGSGRQRVLNYQDGTIMLENDLVVDIDSTFLKRMQKRKAQETVEAENRAKGLVQFEGQWVTPAEKDKIQKTRTAVTAQPVRQARSTIVSQGEPIWRSLQNYKIHTKLFADPKSYFSSELQQRALETEKKDTGNKMTPEQCVSYSAGEMSAFVFIPASYDGKTPYGLYVDIRPDNIGRIPGSYMSVMIAQKMIFVSPHNAGNTVDSFRRLALALDSMASVMKDFSIDSKRVVLGGFSGGGATACIGLMLYPDCFVGVVSHARHAALFPRPMPDRRVYSTTFPFCRQEDYTRVAGLGKRWAFISGPNDMNYGHCKECIPQWEKAGFQAQFFDVPGMSHADAPSEYLDQALKWISR